MPCGAPIDSSMRLVPSYWPPSFCTHFCGLALSSCPTVSRLRPMVPVRGFISPVKPTGTNPGASCCGPIAAFGLKVSSLSIAPPFFAASRSRRRDDRHARRRRRRSLGGELYREDDVLIAGTAAEIPRDRHANLLRRRRRVLAQEREQRHEHSGSAEPALKPVRFAESQLQGMKRAALRPLPAARALRQTFDRRKLPAVHLGRQHETRAHGLTVQQHRAGATDTVLAADVRPREAELVSEE